MKKNNVVTLNLNYSELCLLIIALNRIVFSTDDYYSSKSISLRDKIKHILEKNNF